MTSSTPTAALPSTETINTNTTTLLNLNMSNVSKLTVTNYLMWSLQIHALVDGYALAAHLDGSTAAPPATITIAGTTSENPSVVLWKRQDRLIFSALLGVISTSLQPLVSRAATASEIWNTLASTYAKPSRGHIKQLKTQLKHWTKASKTIDEYLQGSTTRLDQLAIMGKPIDHEDQVELILEGLPEEYKSVVDQIESKDTPPAITEIHERLLNHEAKLLSTMAVSSPFPVTANDVHHRSNNNNQNKPRYNNNNNSSNWSSSPLNNKPDNRVSRPYLGKCQLCNVQGHSAKRCPQL